MRRPSDMPPRPPRRAGRRSGLPGSRGRTAIIVTVAVVFLLATSLRGLAQFYTDYLWFGSVGASNVWSGVVGAKLTLALFFTAVFFVLTMVNLGVADRLSGRAVRIGPSPEDELVLRYREIFDGRRALLMRAAVVGFIAFAFGGGTSGQWNSWLLFRNYVSFGETDATFGRDIGFYVFQLPFLRFVTGWLFSSLLVMVVITVIAHYLHGGIQVQAATDRVSSAVKTHVSVLLALMALVRAAQYWLDRHQLVYSTRGEVHGASYTDVKVELRALDLLVLIALFAMVLFLVNIRRQGWVLPAMAMGIWALVAVLAGEAVPAFVQSFRVNQDAAAREAPYVEQNIAATRSAMGLEEIDTREFAADPDLDATTLEDNADTLRNIRLWDPAQAQRSFLDLQAQLGFFDIPDVDVVRYTVDDDVRQMLVATRQLDETSSLGSGGWRDTHLIYTSGYGVIMAPTNAKTSDGRPDFVVKDIPTTSRAGYPEVERPALYFGEGQHDYKIVGTEQPERQIDDQPLAYDGEDGVVLSSAFRRAAFALRFGDVDILTSGALDSGSRVLMERDVRSRVQSLAPFLALDSDPYPVVLDGRVVYVLDAYTTTDRYPNAQRVSVNQDLPRESGLRRRDFNYLRNSVKAVVDAYDGDVTLYVNDPGDPLIRAYQKAFPGLFTPGDEAPAELTEHYRYPEDMFRAQSVLWGRYHITEPAAFLENQGRWNVAAAPGTGAEAAVPPTTVDTAPAGPNAPVAVPSDASDTEGRIEPTYQLLRLPGEEDEEFVLLRPFTVRDRELLSSFLAATPDGQLVSYEVPSGRSPLGPAIVADRMQNDERIGELRTQFDRDGSRVSFGNVLLVPVGESILYVRSVYVTINENQPDIKAVIVAYQSGDDASVNVEVAATLRDALAQLVPGTTAETLEDEPDPDSALDGIIDGPERTDDPESPPSGAVTEDELVADVQEALARAEDARLRGDLGAYQSAVDEATRLVEELISLRGSAGGSEGPSPTDPEPGGTEPADEPPGGSDEGAPDTGATTTTTTRPSA